MSQPIYTNTISVYHTQKQPKTATGTLSKRGSGTILTTGGQSGGEKHT